MRASKLNGIRKEFERKVQMSINLLQDINGLGLRFSRRNVYEIYELSFLKMFLAWEYFIENTFILYLIGEKCNNGYKPYAHFKPRNKAHAYDLIREGRPYPDWTRQDEIVRRAELYFKKGEPYKNSFALIKTDYDDMKVLRNAIAHSSIKSKERFKALLRRKFGTAIAYMTPGKFLNSVDISSANRIDYFNYYKAKLLIISAKIVK